MNILMFESSLNPSTGGVQRVSWLLASFFKQNGHNVYFAYKKVARLDYDIIPKKDKFLYHDDLNIDEENRFLNYISEKKIDLIVNQDQFTLKAVSLLSAIKKQYPSILIYSVFHNMPKYYVQGINPVLFYAKELVKKMIGFKSFEETICKTSILSDFVVLLSEKYKNEFATNYHICRDKIIAIPNPLSFDEFIKESDMDKKEKIVLSIGRLNECQKNIKETLIIWKSLQIKGYNGWNLVLCGDGPDKKTILDYAKKLHLKNFEYLGPQSNPVPIYRKASILMMTSKYEGFPMTILEALQFGTIPIAYNSFAAITDLIKHKENGFIIENNKRKEFSQILHSIMFGGINLEEIRKNAVLTSKKYMLSNIGNIWLDFIFMNLKYKK